MKHFSLFLLLFITNFTYAQVTSVTNGLVAEYTFNNGNANADFGTVNGTTSNVSLTSDRFGCPNAAYEFSLTNVSSISLGDNYDALWAAPDTSWSVSIWFKLNNLDNDYAPLINKYAHNSCGSDQREFIFRLSADNELEFSFNSSLDVTDNVIVRGSTGINDREWHHAVVTYDGSEDGANGLNRVEIYLDNQLENTSVVSSTGTLGNIQDGTAHLGIGARLDVSGNYCPITGQDHLWDGALDDIRLYSRKLTSNNIDQLYNEGNPCDASIQEQQMEASSVNYTLFPNPTQYNLRVQLTESSKELYQIRIIDISGKETIAPVKFRNQIDINVSELAMATYFVEVRNLGSGVVGRSVFTKH